MHRILWFISQWIFFCCRWKTSEATTVAFRGKECHCDTFLWQPMMMMTIFLLYNLMTHTSIEPPTHCFPTPTFVSVCVLVDYSSIFPFIPPSNSTSLPFVLHEIISFLWLVFPSANTKIDRWSLARRSVLPSTAISSKAARGTRAPFTVPRLLFYV